MNGIVICVNYTVFLRLTLPVNLKYLDRILVVTDTKDWRTQQYVETLEGVELYETDSFYKDGAAFNKGLAMEEGFDILGRKGWICIFDADTMFHQGLSYDFEFGHLYTPRRIIVENITRWKNPPVKPLLEKEFPGYCQIFHADDPAIAEKPWYSPLYGHAGGGDGYFQSRWPKDKKIRPDFNVLHLGPRDQNWFGINEPDKKRKMKELLQSNWKKDYAD